MKLSSSPSQKLEEEQKCLSSELWHACAGPLVSLPAVSSRVVYFPQGHSEQVAATTNKEIDSQIPNYPSLPPQLICQLHNVTMHADIETDEVYAQMTLQPLCPQELKDPFLPAELGVLSKQPTNYFCKTLTASDTSTHGGFSVPRRAAEKVFPPLDFSQQPPAQELIAKDIHGNEWKFRHVFRGQPKRHLLTTGWSVFVSAKRLVAGDSVLFIWNDNNQLLLGIRRANRPQTALPSSVLSSDSMHIGLLAAAAHAAATNSHFTIFYNPRASPSEFVIPLAKYVKAVYNTRISVGMRFRMLFETEESSVRRYMGTITGISDLDPVRWSNSYWRSLKVGWDESAAGERQPRVSLWEIEPLTTFPMYPSPFPLRLKRPWASGLLSFHDGGHPALQSLSFQGMGFNNPWLQPRLDAFVPQLEPDMYQNLVAAAQQDAKVADHMKHESHGMLQFEQPRNMAPTTEALSNRHLEQPQPQQPIVRNIEENQARSQLLQQQLHEQLRNQQMNQQQQLQPIQHIQNHQMVPNVLSGFPQMSSPSQSQPPALRVPSSFSEMQNYQNGNLDPLPVSGSLPLDGTFGQIFPTAGPHHLGLPRTGLPVPDQWSSGTKGMMQQIKELNAEFPQNSTALAPFPRRDCFVGSDANADPQSNVLFGVNIDSSQFGDGAMHDENETSHVSCNFMSSFENGFPLAQAISNSNYVGESRFLHCTEDTGQFNSHSGTFVKVYKSGTVGRSLDITRFSSYSELRAELERLFGLEGQLDDPLRSGWQLVFVDREEDVLLVGDDPWQEFVSNASCIKILSPQEVQKMGKQGLELLSSAPTKRLPNRNCDNISSARIAAMGSLE